MHRQLTALVVDDDAIARMVLVHMLEQHPLIHQVCQAENGDDAWQRLSGGLRPDLVCCDVVMPGMSGIELLQRAKADVRFETTPFIVISSASERAAVQRAIASGAAGFVVKPYAMATVARSVSAAVAAIPSGAEDPAVTCKRLGIDAIQLANMTRALAEDVQTILAGMEGTGALHETTSRLQDGSRLLGLNRCGDLLRRLVDECADAARSAPMLREVQHLVERRCSQLQH